MVSNRIALETIETYFNEWEELDDNNDLVIVYMELLKNGLFVFTVESVGHRSKLAIDWLRRVPVTRPMIYTLVQRHSLHAIDIVHGRLMATWLLTWLERSLRGLLLVQAIVNFDHISVESRPACLLVSAKIAEITCTLEFEPPGGRQMRIVCIEPFIVKSTDT
jgi:hypothetical protein